MSINILKDNQQSIKKLVNLLMKKEDINKHQIKSLLGSKLESSL